LYFPGTVCHTMVFMRAPRNGSTATASRANHQLLELHDSIGRGGRSVARRSNRPQFFKRPQRLATLATI
jgi:hypothetical protein